MTVLVFLVSHLTLSKVPLFVIKQFIVALCSTAVVHANSDIIYRELTNNLVHSCIYIIRNCIVLQPTYIKRIIFLKESSIYLFYTN